LDRQLQSGQAKKFKYTFKEDNECLDLLFSNIEDPNQTIESIINYIVSLLDKEEITCNIFETENFNDSDVQIIPISAKTGAGIHNLRSVLASSQRDLLGDSDTTMVTNQRHVQALSDARASLLRVREGLAFGLPTDLAAQDIREAIYHLGSIVGEISTDEVLGNIFRNFCIGK
jgi:tRNA modification GTPase